jgi:hypothetical protein
MVRPFELSALLCSWRLHILHIFHSTISISCTTLERTDTHDHDILMGTDFQIDAEQIWCFSWFSFDYITFSIKYVCGRQMSFSITNSSADRRRCRCRRHTLKSSNLWWTQNAITCLHQNTCSMQMCIQFGHSTLPFLLSMQFPI